MKMSLFFFIPKSDEYCLFQQFPCKKKFSTEKSSSNTNLFATRALVDYLFTSYCSVCAYKIRGLAHENLQIFAGNLSLISLMLL